MKRSRRIGNEPSFSRIILVSVILHIFFISIFTVPIKTKGRDYRIYSVKLVGPIKTGKKPVKRPKPPKKQKKKVAPKKPETPALEEQPAPPAPKEAPAPKDEVTFEELEMVEKEIERLEAISQLKDKI